MTTAVLASGSGTILEAILGAGVRVDVTVADRPCRALEVAAREGVAEVLVDRAGFGGFGPGFDREAYTAAVSGELERRGVDLVCMAGFGTILAAAFFEQFSGRVLNTHPSLLPSFRGWHPVRDALAAGVEVTGCTVHLATAEVDEGPILRQERVAVLEGDDEATLHERIKSAERRVYPATIALVRAALDRGDTADSVAAEEVATR